MNRYRFAACLGLFCIESALAAPPVDTIGAGGPARQSAIRFQQNRGQIVDKEGRPRPEILFTAAAPGARLYLRRDGISTVFNKITAGKAPTAYDMMHRDAKASVTVEACRVDMTLVGCNAGARVRAEGEVAGEVNFYLRHCPDGILGVKEYAGIVYENIYDRIDLELRSVEGRLKYNFIVHPGGRAGDIRMRYDDAATLTLREDGALAVTTPLGGIEDATPLSYAGESGARVDSRFRLDGRVVSFDIGPYDTAGTLVIDPWSTYYGGSGMDMGNAIALVGGASVNTAGQTLSADFPTKNASQGGHAGSFDAFVVQLDTSGARRWATFYGGSGSDIANGIAADGAGNLYVAGVTESADFPLQLPAQAAIGGASDAFVFKLTASGTRQWATYAGGSAPDGANGIALDGGGNPAIVGYTYSTDFPVLNAAQSTLRGGEDAFVAKFSAAGARLWSTYWGGSDMEYGQGICIDASGVASIIGSTTSMDFPVLNPMGGNPQIAFGGGSNDGFITRFTSSGSASLSIYSGGNGDECGFSIDDMGAHDIWIAYSTNSTDVITHAPITDTNAGGYDIFEARYHDNNKGESTYIGGSGDEYFTKSGLRADGNRWLYFVGSTSGTDFPVQAAIQTNSGGGWDAVYVKNYKSWCYDTRTYLGGSGDDYGNAVDFDADGNVYIAGATSSANFPTYTPLQGNNAGGSDAFVTKIAQCICPNSGHLPHSPETICLDVGDEFVYTFTDVHGIPTPERHWQVSTDGGGTWSDIPGQTGLELRLIVDQSMNHNQYRLVLTNRCGEWVEGPRILSLDASVKVTQQLQDLVLCDDGTPILHFGVSGNNLHYTWYVDSGNGFRAIQSYVHNTTQYDGAHTPDLSIVSLGDLENGKRFFCHVESWDCAGTWLNSDTITLTVDRAPIITRNPMTFKACPGDHVVFSSAANGPPSTTIQWEKDMNDGNGWQEIAGATQPTLEFTLLPEMNGQIFRVVYKNPCGTVTSNVAALIVLQPPTILAQPADIVACPGEVATVSVTSTGVSFQWQEDRGSGFKDIVPDATYSDDTTQALKIRINGAGLDGRRYRCRITGPCPPGVTSNAATLTIAARPIATLVPIGAKEICAGDSVSLRAGGGYTYEWHRDETPIAGATDSVFAASRSGVYRVVVRNGAGCADTSDAFTLVEQPIPDAVILAAGPARFCAGDSVELRATTGAGLRWKWLKDGDSVGTGTPNFVATLPGSYRVIVTGPGGCDDTSAVQMVRVDAPPSARIMGPSSLCPDADAVYAMSRRYVLDTRWSVSGGGVPRTPMAGDSIVIHWTTNGVWTVRASITEISTGCTRDTSLVVTISDVLQPAVTAVGALMFCEGDSVVLDGGSGYARYLWSNGATTQRIVVRQSGTYDVTVHDANGCSGSSLPVTVTVNPVPVASIAGPRVVCVNSPTPYAAADPLARGYAWTAFGGAILSGQGTSAVEVAWTTLGADSLTLSITNDAGCTADTTIAVLVRASLAPAIAVVRGRNPLCEGDTLILDAGDGFTRYLWTNGATSRTIVVTLPGVYAVAVEDASGCGGSSDTLRVVVNPRPDAAITGPAHVCPDMPASFAVFDEPGSVYRWTTVRGIIQSGAAASLASMLWSASGTDTVRVTVRNAAGCEAESSLIVTVDAALKPVIAADGPAEICAGDTVVLDAGPGYATYFWSTGATTRRIAVAIAGVYGVRVTSAGGCAGDADPVTIAVRPAPAPAVSTSDPREFCAGDSARLIADAGYATYVWTRDGAVVPGAGTRAIVARQSGSYAVEVADDIGCRGTSAPLDIIVHFAPVPAIARDGFTLTATPAVAWQWFRDGTRIDTATARSLEAAISGSYVVCVTDAHGCRGCSAPVIVVVNRATSVVSMECAAPPSLPAGSLVTFPVTLAASRFIADTTTAYSVDLRFDRRVLAPRFAHDVVRYAGRDVVARLRGARGALMTEGRLVEPVFQLLLADTACANVAIEEFRWSDGSVKVDFQGTACGVCVDICREGGERLLGMEGRVSLMQNRPNPFNADTRIEYEIIETGHTELCVFNAVGHRVATLVAGDVAPGRYVVRFDASALSSGVYVCVLKTPGVMLQRLMVVVK